MRRTFGLLTAAMMVLLAVPAPASAAADVGGAVDVILSPCQPGYDAYFMHLGYFSVPTDGVYWVDGQLYHSGDRLHEDLWTYNVQVSGVCAPAFMPKGSWSTYSHCLTCIISAKSPAIAFN